MAARSLKSLRPRFAKVRIFLCDVDGVLTDGTVLMGDGREFKRFHVQDGLGLRLLQRGGIKVGWISSRPSTATQQRAEELKIDFLHQAKGDKVAAIESILDRAGFSWEETCYVGDDVVDLGAMKRAGIAIAVANAVEAAKTAANYVARARGGNGAVREIAELILQAQGKWDRLLAEYSG